MKLVALKRVRYPRGGGLAREYAAGQVFEAPDHDADLLIRIKAAKAGEQNSVVDIPFRDLRAPKAAKPIEEPGERDELSEVRAEYKALIGKKPYHAWDKDRLEAEMAEYRTTALTSGDLSNKSMKAED